MVEADTFPVTSGGASCPTGATGPPRAAGVDAGAGGGAVRVIHPTGAATCRRGRGHVSGWHNDPYARVSWRRYDDATVETGIGEEDER
jgi:hypothetical protein